MSARENEVAEAEADTIQRKGVRKMAAFTLLFVVWQIAYFILLRDRADHVRTVDVVRTVGFLFWVGALLGLFVTGGAMFKHRRLKPYLQDELSLALQATCYKFGFWAMVTLCIVGYVVTLWMPLRGIDVAHLVLSSGVLAVLGMRVALERG